MNFIDYADSLKASADRLFDWGLKQRLRASGDLTITGSYALDLLVWPDLDMNLVIEPPKNSEAELIDLVSWFLLSRHVLEVQIKRELNKKHKELPEGTFLNVKWRLPDDKIEWKLDIWIVDRSEQRANAEKMYELNHAMTPARRALILKMKHAFLTKSGRTPKLSSYLLYKAILFENLSSEEQIRNYLTSNGVKL